MEHIYKLILEVLCDLNSKNFTIDKFKNKNRVILIVYTYIDTPKVVYLYTFIVVNLFELTLYFSKT